MEHDVVYRVHLTADPTTRESPTVETEHIDYYDSGIWVHLEEGRDFYPYERIAVIQERRPSVDGRHDTPWSATKEATAAPVDQTTEGQVYIELEEDAGENDDEGEEETEAAAADQARPAE